MNGHSKGDWINDSDAPKEDKEEYRRIANQTAEEEDGCAFGVALIAMCLFLAWALTQVEMLA